MQSLRGRLVVGTLAGMLLLLGSFGLAIYVLQRRDLYGRFDESLKSTAQALVPLVEGADRGKIEFRFGELKMPRFERAERPDYFQIWSLAEERVVARSPSLGDSDLPSEWRHGGDQEIRTVTLPGRRPARAIWLKFTVPGGGPPSRRPPPTPVVLAVTADTQPLEETLAYLRLLLAGAGVGAGALAALVGWGVVGHGLRPVRQLEAEIGSIGDQNLTRRVDVSPLPAEMRRMAIRLNELLDRLQAAFERERAFIADAAHEFRTPLAGLRSSAEVALRREGDANGCRAALVQTIEIACGMQNLIDKLLLLARMDAGQVRLDLTVVPLRPLIDATWELCSRTATHRRISLENRLPEPCCCLADADLVSLIAANLLINAAQYADEGAAVLVEAADDDGTLRLCVINQASSMPAENVPRLFERFWRGDSGRGSTGEHAGLGLSLVYRAAALLGGSAAAALSASNKLCICVRLPLAPAGATT